VCACPTASGANLGPFASRREHRGGSVNVHPVQKRWPQIRAFLITIALVLGGLSGIPDSSPRRLQLVPPFLRTMREVLQSVQNAALVPMRFVPETLQFSQHWKLFSGVNDVRFLIHIDAREKDGSPWELVYRPHDPEHHWREWTLEYRRVRGNWNPSRSGTNRGYDAFTTWVARRLFQDEPRFESVRVRMEEVALLPDGRGFVPLGRFLHERVRHRREVTP